jgi:hypothetical protein
MERRSPGMLWSLLRPGSHARGSARASLAAPADRWLACCVLGMLSSTWAGNAQSLPALRAPIAAQPLSEALVEFQFLNPKAVRIYEPAAGFKRTDSNALQSTRMVARRNVAGMEVLSSSVLVF